MLPTLTLHDVQHIGTLNPNDIGQRGAGGRVSFEGHHFSVSLNPDEWRRIAELGDAPQWTLRKTGGTFLDANAIWDDEQAALHLRTWALTRHLITLEATYLTRHLTPDGPAWQTHPTPEAAARSLRADLRALRHPAADHLPIHNPHHLTRHLARHPDLHVTLGGPPFQPALNWLGTPELTALTGLPSEMGETGTLIAYAEEHELDGVWWTDAISWWWAPRGLILRSRLNTWHAQTTLKEVAD